jgi:hypothetical protein
MIIGPLQNNPLMVIFGCVKYFCSVHIESNFAKSYPHITYLSCEKIIQTIPCEESYLDKRNALTTYLVEVVNR